MRKAKGKDCLPVTVAKNDIDNLRIYALLYSFAALPKILKIWKQPK